MQYLVTFTEMLEIDRHIVVECPDKTHTIDVLESAYKAVDRANKEHSFDGVLDSLKSNGLVPTKYSKVDYEHPRLAAYEVSTAYEIKKG